MQTSVKLRQQSLQFNYKFKNQYEKLKFEFLRWSIFCLDLPSLKQSNYHGYGCLSEENVNYIMYCNKIKEVWCETCNTVHSLQERLFVTMHIFSTVCSFHFRFQSIGCENIFRVIPLSLSQIDIMQSRLQSEFWKKCKMLWKGSRYAF